MEEQQEQEQEQTQEQGTYVRRPLQRINRKRYAEAIKCLKGAMACEQLSWRSRLRAVELMMVIFGDEIGLPDARTRKSVKALVCENAFERQVRTRVREGVLGQTAREAKAEAERYLAEQEQRQQQEDAGLLKSFWNLRQGQEPTGNA